MPIVVQVVNLQGKTIENARWTVPTPPGLQEGQSFALSLVSEDVNLISYLTKSRAADCTMEKEGGKVYITLSFAVKRIRHMYTPTAATDKQLETLCQISPLNRTVEQILTYLVAPAKTDAQWVRALRGAT